MTDGHPALPMPVVRQGAVSRDVQREPHSPTFGGSTLCDILKNLARQHSTATRLVAGGGVEKAVTGPSKGPSSSTPVVRNAEVPTLHGHQPWLTSWAPALAENPANLPVRPMPANRRIVLCLDGTWNNTYDRRQRTDGLQIVKPSNVLKLCRAVLPRDQAGVDQVVYYDIGVGALAEYPGLSNRLLHLADRVLGGGWGAGFEGNIDDALHFLTLNYQPTDEVFVFGFSRGAATARGLTRFLDWAGGLPAKSDAYYLPRLFRGFVDGHGDRPVGDELSEINRDRARGPRPLPPLRPLRPISIKFLGVWDTVMALGSRFRAARRDGTSAASRSFYLDREPAGCVTHARQALAIDEVRYDFRPEIWTGCHPHQSLAQRWFAGVHSNVGGGYIDDGLANVTLQWMLKGAAEHGLAVDAEFAARYRGFAQDRLYRSETLVYRLLDHLRLRFGRGRRAMVNQPLGANLSVDRSVIHRICADPRERRRESGESRFPELVEPYRPENVIEWLADQPDLSSCLETMGLSPADRQLPPDVIHRIQALRKASSRT